MGNVVERTRTEWVRRRPDPLDWLLEAYYRLYILYATQRAVNNVAYVVNGVVQALTHGTITIKNREDFISLINSTEELRLTYYQNVLFNNMRGDFWVAFPGHLPLPRISTDTTMEYNFDKRNPFVNI